MSLTLNKNILSFLDLKNLSFYVIHVNYYYTRLIDNSNDIEYYPAEIALAECSLTKGVIRILNLIINEKVKIGFTASAKEHSANTHKIPIYEDQVEGLSDYTEIFQKIIEFLEPGRENRKLPPMYTLFSKEDIYRPTKSVLGRIALMNG